MIDLQLLRDGPRRMHGVVAVDGLAPSPRLAGSMVCCCGGPRSRVAGFRVASEAVLWRRSFTVQGDMDAFGRVVRRSHGAGRLARLH